MKLLQLLSLVLLSYEVASQDLDFANTTPVYPNGAKNHSYTSIGTPATDITIAVMDNSPSSFVGMFQPRPRADGLQGQVNFSSNTQCVTFTITFAAAVANLSFNMLGIDRGTANGTTPETYTFVDKITITGSLFGSPVSPTIGSDNGSPMATVGNVVSGNVITGNANKDDASNAVSFSRVSAVTITYCNDASAQADPASGQSFTIGDMSWEGPLPVLLTSFVAAPAANAVKLRWTTAAETNSSHFDVEKSTNGQSFERIGRVAAARASDQLQTYSFADENPREGWSYYRLKNVDLDNSFAYSRLIAAFFEENATYFQNYIVADGLLRVHTNAKSPVFEVFDLTGRSVLQNAEKTDETNYTLKTDAHSSMLLIRAVATDGQVFRQKIIRN